MGGWIGEGWGRGGGGSGRRGLLELPGGGYVRVGGEGGRGMG